MAVWFRVDADPQTTNGKAAGAWSQENNLCFPLGWSPLAPGICETAPAGFARATRSLELGRQHRFRRGTREIRPRPPPALSSSVAPIIFLFPLWFIFPRGYVKAQLFSGIKSVSVSLFFLVARPLKMAQAPKQGCIGLPSFFQG